MQNNKSNQATPFFEIPYYHDYISPALAKHLLSKALPVDGVRGLYQVGPSGGLESTEAMSFLVELYDAIKENLADVLQKRIDDRKFIDERVHACFEYNKKLNIDVLDPDYKTIIGLRDANNRIVVGPNSSSFSSRGGKPIAPIPDYLKGPHVTLFGPPDSAKMAVNAMNAYHRKLKGEPAIVEDLLATQQANPKWGADDEDSKTPLHQDLIDSAVNLTACFDRTLRLEENGKKYELAKDHLSAPMKRFPGLALPSTFLFYNNNPMPLHLYDFALHLVKNWHNKESLAFYIPKLENEEEAGYIHRMIAVAEDMIKVKHPEYVLGSIRIMIVLENPRAILRAHEIMDELYPYFVGASLGWHDYLGSTARLFKEDGNYRIPVKADPYIVIKYIKASHSLLADVVGSRGGIKVGGMYGILPSDTQIESPSFQIALKGFFKDVITQLKRDLTGFWVAHPDFVRLGLAIVEAWKRHEKGDKTAIFTLTRDIFSEKHRVEVDEFIQRADAVGLDQNDHNYVRALLVADIKESDYIANNHPDEIRYNVFQSLQYLTDWLSGNGCVALPTIIDGVPVRVMDDLATAERSRWEVWHELNHSRFCLDEFLRICHEEMRFIRKDLSDDKKIVQVKWDERTEKWYPIAFRIMIQLMTAKNPVEFATELLMPFTVGEIRNDANPWQKVQSIDADKYRLDAYVERWLYYFERCGCQDFAVKMANNAILDIAAVEKLIKEFTLDQVNEAASFHGDIGESAKTLDHLAQSEQKLVQNAEGEIKNELRILRKTYREKFGFKFLVAARGRSATELLDILKHRMTRSIPEELTSARKALWEITATRMSDHPTGSVQKSLHSILKKYQIDGASIAVANSAGLQSLSIGDAVREKEPVHKSTLFELASLSKTIASAFAIEFCANHGISLTDTVNTVFAKTSSSYRLKSSKNAAFAEDVTIAQLMSHQALNMHYVKGFPVDGEMPKISDLVLHADKFGYEAIDVPAKPGVQFQYSGGGFLVLEYLMECLSGKSIIDLTASFLQKLGIEDLTFQQKTIPQKTYASGYFDDGLPVPGGRMMFPAFAAGAMGSATAMMQFLRHLEAGYHNLNGSGAISHDTAMLMMHGRDLGCREFMGCDIGLGVFIAEAGDNRIAIHQGSNEGFRALSLHVIAGPDRGKGFVILCNGDNRAVLCVAEMAQVLLKALEFSGVHFEKFSQNFETGSLSQEQIVNLGYKQLIFSAFEPMMAEPIPDRKIQDPLASYNLLVGAIFTRVSNQRFARAENLISSYEPVFDPKLFGKQGKVMDSWESVRHNPIGVDVLECILQKPSEIQYLRISTKFHDGNQPQFVRILGRIDAKNSWVEILPKIAMNGHSYRCIKLPKPTVVMQEVRVEMYPDGGLTRVGLYADVPAEFKKEFLSLDISECIRFSDPIPHSQKPLTIPFHIDVDEVERNLRRSSNADFKHDIDYASAAFGGSLVRATNEHYGPAVQVISPFPAMNMFDGLESARSREVGHYEEVVLKLGKAVVIDRVVFDFKFFVNNNPVAVEILGWDGKAWLQFSGLVPVKAFAGNKKELRIQSEIATDQIMVRTYPDGGVNRLHVYGRETSGL